MGGSPVPSGELPFVVALYMNVSGEVKFHCGGSLVTNYHVITAGHCVKGWYAERFTVRWSSNHDLASPSPDERIIQVDEIKLFPYFHFELGTSIPTNDIAIVTLSEPLLDASGLIAMPDQDEGPAAGTVCTTAGWGNLEEGGETVTTLYSVDVEIQDYSTCIASHGNKMRETMICAGYPEGGKDACNGDSGGPLICNGILSGIVSWGDGCAEPDKYGVYTNTALYVGWIEKHNFVLGYPEGSEF